MSRVAAWSSSASRATGGRSWRARLERDPAVDVPRRDRQRAARGGARADGLHRGRHPQRRCSPACCPATRGGHGRPLRDPLVPRAGQAGAGPARRQRHRHAAAPCRLPADRDPQAAWSSAGRPRSTAARARRRRSSRRRWRGRCRCAPASSAMPPSSRRTSTTSPAAIRRSSAACSATSPRSGRSSTRRWSGTCSLPVGPHPARLRPPASVAPRRRRPRRARGGDAEPGPRPGQRRAVGLDLAEPHAASRPAPAARADSPSALRPCARAAWASCLGAGPLYGDGVRLLRFGRGVDNRRLRTELGYEPRFDAEAAIRDFAAKISWPPGAARRCTRGISPDGSAGGRSVNATRRQARDGARDVASTLRPRGGRGLPAPDAGRDRGRPRPDERGAAGGRRASEALREALERSPSGCRASTTRTSGGSTRSSRRRSTRVRVPLRGLVAGRGRRRHQRPRPRPGAPGRQPRRLAVPLRRVDDPRLSIMKQHPLPRWARFMVLDWAFVLPFISTFMRRVGGVPASPHNAARLLEQDELVMVFPEGDQGNRQAVLRALPPAALRPRRVRRGGAADRRADRAGRRRRLRGDLPEARRAQAAGAGDRRALRPGHPDLPLARASSG